MDKDFQLIQSKTINWLRFPLIVLVVYIHNYGSPYDYTPIINWANLSSYDIYEIIRIFFSKVISHLAVPCFFFISGYLFFYNIDELNKLTYITKLKKRIKTLLIPYLLWNSFAVIIDFYNFKNNSSFSDSIIHTASNLWYYFYNPLDYPLWYVRNLIILSIISPLYFKIINKGPIFFAILLLLFLIVLGDKTNANSFVFFGFGALLSIKKLNIITTFRRIKKPMYIIALITMCLCVYYNSKYTNLGKRIYPLFILSGIISIFNIASFSIEKNYLKENVFLTSSVFFIYAIHILDPIIWMDKYFNQAFTLFEGNYWLCLFIYLIQPLIKISLCIILFFIMKCIVPKFVNIATGSRT